MYFYLTKDKLFKLFRSNINMSAIGMMDGAFFVGRKEIVDWVNDTLNVNISKVKISILLILIN